MKSYEKFWTEEKKAIANLCEAKNCRLFWDNLQSTFYVVKKYADGSVYHERATELLASPNIETVNEFINKYNG